ncbi:hypothetical protein QQF64_036344 [Cirrhinus molitorella]|uniref:Uncharacterized protein n=1 Tax=Cirrhinus molitorella TaxID=172907 RepID=A0ABR3NIV4_9TELE
MEASAKIKALIDNIAELEQGFFLFKEETSNNLQQALNLSSHQSIQQLQQLRHLEEDNQELRMSPQAHQNFMRKGSSIQIHPPATTTSTINGREQKRKDSNGLHLDPR